MTYFFQDDLSVRLHNLLNQIQNLRRPQNGMTFRGGSLNGFIHTSMEINDPPVNAHTFGVRVDGDCDRELLFFWFSFLTLHHQLSLRCTVIQLVAAHHFRGGFKRKKHNNNNNNPQDNHHTSTHARTNVRTNSCMKDERFVEQSNNGRRQY